MLKVIPYISYIGPLFQLNLLDVSMSNFFSSPGHIDNTFIILRVGYPEKLCLSQSTYFTALPLLESHDQKCYQLVGCLHSKYLLSLVKTTAIIELINIQPYTMLTFKSDNFLFRVLRYCKAGRSNMQTP